jgi:acyl-CoA dehydrogenase
MSSNISRLAARKVESHADRLADLRTRAQAAAEAAARHAAAVDHEARFPHEAFQAIREQKLLGLFIPEALGGEGASLSEIVDVCYILGRACASTAMIFAMHQTKVACLVRHAQGAAWQEGLQRRVAEEQLLLASSTTEGSNGGNVRSSEAAVQRRDGRISFERVASVISYCEHADGIVTTARRDENGAASDQVLIAFLKQDYTLERMQTWETLGMRGTCSFGVILRATGEPDQVVAEPYERIHAQTMVPFAHMYWSAVWTGIAAGAVQRARAFVRAAARGAGGKPPPAAAHLTRARLSLETLRRAVQSAVAQFERGPRGDGALEALEAQTSITFLKVEASELAVSVVMSAMRTCGLAGYRNDGEFSLGRSLRDILSSPIMINNDRILANAEAAVLMSDVPVGLTA